MIIVISENDDDRNRRLVKILRESSGFIEIARLRQIPREQKEIRAAFERAKMPAHSVIGSTVIVNIADRRDPDHPTSSASGGRRELLHADLIFDSARWKTFARDFFDGHCAARPGKPATKNNSVPDFST